jgi:hypothetical protein
VRLNFGPTNLRSYWKDVTSEALDLGVTLHTDGFESAVLMSWLEQQRKEFRDLESAAVFLEAALRLSHVPDREKELELAQQASRAAEGKLEDARKAAGLAESAADTLKRISGEIVDERLAAISPLLEELYGRLRPDIDWPEISYLVRDLVETLTAIRRMGTQIVCTVEDAELGELLARRLRSTQESAGLVIEMYKPQREGRF